MAGSSYEEVSSRILDVTTCHHISLRHMERTMTISCCGLLFFLKEEKTVPIELCCDQQKLNCTILFLYACYHRHSVHVTRDLTLFVLTYVQNQTPWKNEKVMTINLLQPVVLKILLCALSSWCASAIAGFPHSKNNIAVFLHVKHNNSATLPWLGAIVKQISLLYIITSLSKQAATQNSLIFLKFNWNLTVLQTLRIL